jgi:hypothetical protein
VLAALAAYVGEPAQGVGELLEQPVRGAGPAGGGDAQRAGRVSVGGRDGGVTVGTAAASSSALELTAICAASAGGTPSMVSRRMTTSRATSEGL